MSDSILIVRCGLVPYEAAFAAQQELEGRRQREEIGDVLLLLEHPPVYTRGRRSTADELPMGVEWYEQQGIEVLDTDRGGRVTYHGPGQLVAYPIVSLAPYDDDVHAYVRRLEQVMIGALAEHGVQAGLIAGQTGVWVGRPEDGVNPGPAEGPSTLGARKIGSIGIHVSHGVTTHGLVGKRQQRPAAVRVGRALRNRRLRGDLAGPRARCRAGPRRLRRHGRATGSARSSSASRLPPIRLIWACAYQAVGWRSADERRLHPHDH